jgi:hypothetical protein
MGPGVRAVWNRDVINAAPPAGARISPTVIPALSIIEQMAEHRAPLAVFAATSSAAQCYEQLWAEVRPR